MSFPRFVFSVLLLGACSLLLVACSPGAGNDQPRTGMGAFSANGDAQSVRFPVEVAGIERGVAESSYSATAALRAEEQATVVSRTSGIVLEVLAEEGDVVERGQVLARLDDDRLKLEVERARAARDQAEADLARARQLAARDLGSSEQFEQARSNAATQQANYELAVLEASYATIRAPFDGVISERHISLGNLVQMHDPLFVMHQVSPLRVEIHVPETRLAGIQVGAPVRMRVDALEGEVFDGEVLRISPTVDAGSGTVRLTAMLDNSEQRMRPGMFGRVEVIQERREQAILVPRSAVVRQDGERWVFVVRDQQAVKVPVTLGLESREQVELLDGPQEGEWIITAGQHSVADGADVDVINRNGAVDEHDPQADPEQGNGSGESQPAEAAAEQDE